MNIAVKNIQGGEAGREVELPADIFGIEPNEHAVYLAVKQYLAHQRQGTHKAKERGEITGSTKKIKRQKGTGTARAGSIKSPLFRSGGRVFGPRPRNYEIKLNKKVKRLARKSAFSTKATNGQIVVLEDFSFDAPKTKELAKIMGSLNTQGSKTVLVTSDFDQKVFLAGRNLPKTNVMRAQDLCTYDIMNCQTLILSEGAIEKIKETFA